MKTPTSQRRRSLTLPAIIGGLLALATLGGLEPIARIGRSLGPIGVLILAVAPIAIVALRDKARRDAQFREWWAELRDPSRPRRATPGPKPALPKPPSPPVLHQPLLVRVYGKPGQDTRSVAAAFERDAIKQTQAGYELSSRHRPRPAANGSLTVTYKVSAAGKRADELAVARHRAAVVEWEQSVEAAKLDIAAWYERKRELDDAYQAAIGAWLRARRGLAMPAGVGAPAEPRPTPLPASIAAGTIGVVAMALVLMVGLLDGGAGTVAAATAPTPSPSERAVVDPTATAAESSMPRATGTPRAAPAPTPTPSPSLTRPPTPTPTPPPSPTPTPSPSATPTPITLGTAPIGPTETATVLRVIDGDTIEVDRGHGPESVRYIGIDTPETVHPTEPVEWMGKEASEANRQLVEGREVMLESDLSEVDQYGRLLRYVWTQEPGGWVFVNLALVTKGYAQVVTYPPDVRYVDLYLVRERTAREQGAGLWGEPPPAPKPTPQPTPRQPVSAPNDCHDSYSNVCLTPGIGDYDCAGGSGNGPNYVAGPVYVVGDDEFGLDGNDNDGIGCESG